MELTLAPDIQKLLNQVQKQLQLPHINLKQIVCCRSHGSTARARARIWAFPRIWQMALKLPAYYCIEVISEKFDHLSESDRKKILVHELMHIPKNFSGAVLSHTRNWHRNLDQQLKKL